VDKKLEAELLSKVPPKPPGLTTGGKREAEVDPTQVFGELFKKPETIKDKTGTEHKLSELDFDKDWELMYKTKKLISDAGSQNWDTLLGDIIELEDGKERVLEIVGLFLDKDKTFVRTNFTFNGLVGMLFPFLVSMVTLGKNQGAKTDLQNLSTG